MLVTNANAPKECTECAEQNSGNAFSGIAASSQSRLDSRESRFELCFKLNPDINSYNLFFYGTVGFVLFLLILTSSAPGQSVKPGHPI
jgi:hypothetical protein